MAERRPDGDDSSSRSKRQKTNGKDLNPEANPYLAHMYEDQNGYGSSNNGYSSMKPRTNLFASLTRHSTTAEQARVAEDGPDNPFNGRPLSKRYFSILETRRKLPVHAQR